MRVPLIDLLSIVYFYFFLLYLLSTTIKKKKKIEQMWGQRNGCWEIGSLQTNRISTVLLTGGRHTDRGYYLLFFWQNHTLSSSSFCSLWSGLVVRPCCVLLFWSRYSCTYLTRMSMKLYRNFVVLSYYLGTGWKLLLTDMVFVAWKINV